jgi:hypothetical protein
MTKAHDYVTQRMAHLVRAGTPAQHISFSREGILQAKLQEDRDVVRFGADRSETYMGLPYRVDPEQDLDVMVHSEPMPERPVDPMALVNVVLQCALWGIDEQLGDTDEVEGSAGSAVRYAMRHIKVDGRRFVITVAEQ